MKRIKLILIAAAVLIVAGSFVTVSIQSLKIKAQKIEIARVTRNYKVAHDSIVMIENVNGLLAARIEAQDLTTNELKSYYQNIVADVADMKISLRKVTSITAFNTETTNEINTFFKDSTRINRVPLETLSYSDMWVDIDIEKDSLKAHIKIVSRDSLINVIHWSRTGKFWPTRFLTEKVYEQDIKSMNPNSRITYAKWIKVFKKKD